MSGSADGTGGTGGTGSGLSALMSQFTGPGAGSNAAGASQFAMPGGAASQFMMPGGNIPQFQGGASMMPAALGGVQGVADANNFTNAVQQNAGGMTPANWAQMGQNLAQGMGGTGKLAAPQASHMPFVQGGARPANMGQMNFTPQQLSLLQPQLGAQGGGVNSLLQMLSGANSGFKV